MSLARAFTTRRAKHSVLAAEDSLPHRSNTTKGLIPTSVRSKISGPIELVHTTNMLSYNAPDLFPKLATSATSPTSGDDGSLSDSTHTNHSTPPTSPDVSYPAKKTSTAVKPNHLSCYFSPPAEFLPPGQTINTPIVPQRAPSHTTTSFDTPPSSGSVSRFSESSRRTASTKTMSALSRSISRSSSSSATTSTTSATMTPHYIQKTLPSANGAPTQTLSARTSGEKKDLSYMQSHPFGFELAQVTEIAEEHGVQERLDIADREEQELSSKGLIKFSADEYLNEVQALFRSFFVDIRPALPAATAWI